MRSVCKRRGHNTLKRKRKRGRGRRGLVKDDSGAFTGRFVTQLSLRQEGGKERERATVAERWRRGGGRK